MNDQGDKGTRVWCCVWMDMSIDAKAVLAVPGVSLAPTQTTSFDDNRCHRVCIYCKIMTVPIIEAVSGVVFVTWRAC